MSKLYELTNDHRAQLKPWADKWIANAMSTSAMTDADREVCRDAVRRLYEAGGCAPPPDGRIVFVSSPMVTRFAAGAAAWVWHQRNATADATRAATFNATLNATYDATAAATRNAIAAATYDATYDATHAATYDATHAATYAATRNAIDAATDDATHAATYDATHAATYAATRNAIDAATDDATDAATYAATYAAIDDATYSKWYVGADGCARACAEFGQESLGCAQKTYWSMWQGGNQWSAYDSFLSFFRHVAKLDIEYSKWDAWETLSLHSGPRVVHKDFCIISDRPEILLVDDQDRPHCDTGPFCRWRDGVALYAVHGHYVPAWIIERPDLITVAKIDAETNAETRRIMIDKFGPARFVTEGGGVLIDDNPVHGKLWRRDRNGDSPILMLEVQNPTIEPDGTVRTFWIRVHPECRPFRARDKFLGAPQPLTALNARASTWGLTGAVFADRLQFAA